MGKEHQKDILRQILHCLSLDEADGVLLLPLPPSGRKQRVDPRKARASNLSAKAFERRGRWLGLPLRAGNAGSPEARAGGSMSRAWSELASWEETAGGRPPGPSILSLSLPHRLMSLRMPLVLASHARGLPKIDRTPGASCHCPSYCLYEPCEFKDHILTLPLHA